MKLKRSLMCIMTAALMAFPLFAGCTPQEEKPPVVVPPEEPPIEQEIPEGTVTTTKLTVYEAPNLLESSSKVKAYVEDNELFVYETRVNHNRIFSYSYSKDLGQVVSFDFEGKVHMKVEVQDASALTDVVVRPVSYAIQPQVKGNVIEFDLEYSANYTLEYNDGKVTDAADNALHIFANPIEENPVDPDNVPDNVIYVGPGVYSAGALPLKSNSTVYLAGGAYVYGQIRSEALENITIRGRGIISGSIYERTQASEYTLPIELRSCKNVKIEGISILDPAGWAITLYKCEKVDIDNVKIITARANGDGISVQSCKDVNVTGGFVRTWDDSLVVKNSDRGTTSDITFDNVTVWTDLAQSCEVGYETNGATMDNITFKNITILHNYHKAAMSIHNCDDADITNVTYQNITIEDASMLGDNQLDGLNDFLIDIVIAYNENWTTTTGVRGTVSDVRFENIKVLSMKDSIVSRINGESAASPVKNVTVRGVEIEGKTYSTADELKLVANTYTSNVNVVAATYEVTGALVKLPYNLQLEDDVVATTVVESHRQEGLEVPDFALLDVQETYMGVKLNLSDATFAATHGVGSKIAAAYDDGTGQFEIAGSEVAKAFDGDRNTAYVAKQWTGDEEEFAAITVDFGKQVAPGVIRVYLAEDSNFVYDYNIRVCVKSKADSKSFTSAVSTTTYSSTPATGNYFDIKLSADLTCFALQLRIFRNSGITAPKQLSINEIAFYPSSLSTTKPIVDSTEHNDVYVANYLVDGNESTYWEAATADGAFFTVDLGGIYSVQYIVMHLPPVLTWPEKHQEIEILASEDGKNWTTVAEKKNYTFDPLTGNSVSVQLTTAVRARYVKLVWYSNDSGYGAQLSELYVYGE